MEMLLFLVCLLTFTYALQFSNIREDEIEIIHISSCNSGMKRKFTKTQFQRLQITGLKTCFDECFGTTDDYPDDYSLFENVLKGSLFEVTLLTQKRNKTVLGTVSLCPLEEKRIVAIYNLCLRKDMRNKGYGEYLLEKALENHLIHCGFQPTCQHPILLVLTIQKESSLFISACKLYRKMGFYLCEDGNFASQLENFSKLQSKMLKLQTVSLQRLIFRESLANERRSFINEQWKDDDGFVTMYRLDVGIGGQLRFALPPSNYCLRLQER
jgi:ribosomal protein S18 acetylase RimI-like enzyme